nr:hypothetical protein [Streptomyces sp. KL118A]
MTEVARGAEVTKGFLSQLERGLTSVSVPPAGRFTSSTIRVGR